eukprot:CAMPEP_0116906870 /NCGR_PEP_ID=MMETSP0467-20121206/12768_1 /TAXON_ID=283647 /ORGANISM="Mesodinium pulex, Strain SPMC105" /LENGTH=33 /DNA_ID= /DNA_START= /DNA_END= /DNA_ORIENTATION=
MSPNQSFVGINEEDSMTKHNKNFMDTDSKSIEI